MWCTGPHIGIPVTVPVLMSTSSFWEHYCRPTPTDAQILAPQPQGLTMLRLKDQVIHAAQGRMDQVSYTEGDSAALRGA